MRGREVKYRPTITPDALKILGGEFSEALRASIIGKKKRGGGEREKDKEESSGYRN